jgi:hypothetical protein
MVPGAKEYQLESGGESFVGMLAWSRHNIVLSNDEAVRAGNSARLNSISFGECVFKSVWIVRA